MVTPKSISKWLLGAMLTFSAATFAQESKVPTPDQVKAQAEKVQADIVAFAKSTTSDKFKDLKDDLVAFKIMLANTAQALNVRKGGAATPRALAAKDALSEYGLDIANALLDVRTSREDALKDKNLEQPFEDLMVNEIEFPMFEMAFRLAIKGVDERSSVDGLTTAWDVFRRTFTEVGRNIIYLGRCGVNRSTGEFYWGPLEAYRQENAVCELIPRMAEYADARIPIYNKEHDGDVEYERDRHEERLAGLMLWMTDRMVNIRVERNSAEHYSKWFYGIAGTIWASTFWTNFFDDAYSSELETSGYIMLGTAAVMIMKEAIASTKSTGLWFELNQKIRSEMAPTLVKSTELFLEKSNPTEYNPAQVPAWIKRRLAYRSAMGKAFKFCTGWLTDMTGRGKKAEKEKVESK